MEQLPLEIAGPIEPTLDNFVAGPNLEALARVRELATGRPVEPVVYLWGAPGSGCTHLLRAAALAGGGRYYGPGDAPSAEAATLVAADTVEALDERGQVALFVQLNRARAGETRVLACGNNAPAALALRPDLATRLGGGLVYQLRPLKEDDKKRHLRAEAARRGIELSEDVLTYLLTRLPRDIPTLTAALAHLDRHSLARQRALTLPLVRDALRKFPSRREESDPPT